ncbi:MAG: alkaline phosphatase, partial [Mesorhizobium sp.]|nr:alkaline phosphatase [Mesorhizobium sp.]
MPGEDPRNAGEAVSGGRNDSSNRRFPLSGKRGWRQFVARLVGSTAILPVTTLATHAQEVSKEAISSIGTVEVIQLAVSVGVMGAALISAIVLIRERQRTAAENAQLRTRVADVNASLQRSEALLNLRDQRIVVWASENKKPEIIGSLPL